MRYLLAVAALLALAGCGSGGQAGEGAGGATAGEAKALDEAAEMLEERKLPNDALHPPAPAEQQAASETPQAPAD